jgi:hypothetical protein
METRRKIEARHGSVTIISSACAPKINPSLLHKEKRMVIQLRI